MASLALLFVVGGSVAMERAASALGESYAVPQIVVGGLVLAAVTSLPNVVAAIYLSARGRGAATLSTALNSNALNVVAGLLIPGTIIGLGAPTAHATLAGAWYAGLTMVALALAYGDRGLLGDAGVLIVAGYLVFAGSLLAAVRDPSLDPGVPIAGAVVFALAAIVRPGIGHVLRSLESAVGLAVLLGVPDGIWATGFQLAFLAAVATVGLANTAAAAITDWLRP